MRISKREHADSEMKEWLEHVLSFAILEAPYFCGEPFPAFSDPHRACKAMVEYVVARTSKGLSAKGRARERKIELVPGAGGCTA